MKHLFLFVTLVTAISITACINPLDDLKTGSLSKGTVTISVAGSDGRTLIPAAAQIQSYSISGTGPSGASAGPQTNPNGNFSFTGIIAGNWTFTINGLNSDEEIIASGTVQLTVAAGSGANATVALKPLDGTGTFSVQLSWPAEQLADTVAVSLSSINGASVPASFTLSGSTAELNTVLNTGSYLVSLHVLREGKRISRQLNEAVQIFRDQTTSWVYEFTPEDFRALYTITYHANGSSDPVPVDTTLYFRGDTAPILGDADTMSLDGYTFSHWNTQADGQGAVYDFGGTLTIGTESINLYARFLLEQCTGLTPPTGSATKQDWPTLEWDALGAAASYEVQIVNAASGIEAIEAAPLVPAGTNSLSTSSANAPIALNWYWRVRGVDSHGEKGQWSDTAQLTVGWERHTIVLNGPDHNTITTDTTPELHWATINGTIRYEMQMANTEGAVGGSAVINKESATSWIPDDALNNKTDYFWRIRAVTTDVISGDEVATGWSTIRKFRVQWGLEGPLDGIRFPKELALLATDTTLLGGTYIQTADLDLSGYTNWTPIGTASNKFTGTFDGNGHTIHGLTTTGTSDNRGLFGYTGPGSHIQNVSLTAVNVRGGGETGALIGYCEGDVTNCNATGTVHAASGSKHFSGGLIGKAVIPAAGTSISIRDSWANCAMTGTKLYTGGLIGGVQGRNLDTMVTIQNCHALGNVTITTTTVQTVVGGLIGEITGYTRIDHVYATGTVTGSGEYAGGLVGRVWYSAVSAPDQLHVFISNSYATGDVSGRYYCGGLIGSNGAVISSAQSGAHIRSCFATGNISASVLSTGIAYIGGLVGFNYSFSIIEDSYARGNVTTSAASAGGLVGETTSSGQVLRGYSTGQVSSAAASVGGLVGRRTSSTVTDSYYDRETSGRSDTGKGIPHYTPEMKTESTFEGWDFTGNPGEGIEAVWAIDPAGYINNGYPYLKALMP